MCFSAVETPKNPNSAKECAICHYRWIDTFFIYGKGSDLVEYHSEKVVASFGMCFSCHDGSVKDSRAKINNDYWHKIQTSKTKRQMKIPEIFPVGKDGKFECATCHTAHGVPSGEGVNSTIFMRTSHKDSAMCRTCHTDKDGNAGMGSHPMGNTQKPVAASLIAKGARAGEKNNQISCETCHTPHGSPYEKFLVEGSGNCQLCLDCHTDKNILTPTGAKKPYHMINGAPKNVSIPETLIKKGAVLGYNGVLTCQTCHKVHNNNPDHPMLLIEKNNKSSLCLTCHSDKQLLADTKHNLMQSAPKEKNLQGQTAAEAGICSSCHLPHKAARKIDGEKEVSSELCLSCHSKGNISEKVKFAGMSHPIYVNPFKNKTAGSFFNMVDASSDTLALPLFNGLGVQDQNGRLTCSTCHNPHESKDGLIKENQIQQNKKDKRTYFLRKLPPDICKDCHKSKFLIANSKHDLVKVFPESKNALNQDPSESGLCGSCHSVHRGGKEFLWARNMSENQLNTVEELCLNCHNKDGLAKNKPINEPSHPINMSPYEKKLTTTLPLFDASNNLSPNGNIACHTCHNPHQWDTEKTRPDEYSDKEGNCQNSFLRLKNAPSSQLCKNCHKDKADIEQTDHDLTISAPQSINIIGQTPMESGVCGTCHLTHNSKNQVVLWAQKISGSGSIMDRMCMSCHSKNGPGKNKVPEALFHPKDKLVINVERDIKDQPDFFPIYHETTGKMLNVGDISCPSCHNAHQWGLKTLNAGKGQNMEGNATNSFLRVEALLVACRDCHGTDTLLKIKYFHNFDKRKKKSGGRLN
jgi:predicted CXXCH cytochrome family protein